MNAKSIGLLLAGFTAGLLVSRLPHAAAASDSVAADLAKKEFLVSIDEIRQNFVFGDPFVGHYYKEVTLSDGTTRRIELTPMVHDGIQVVEFKDNKGTHYMGLNGAQTDGTLMVQVLDIEGMGALARAEGWPWPTASGGKYPIPILPMLPVHVVFQRVHGSDSEEMTITNETERPMHLYVAIFNNSGKFVGTRRMPVPAHASSTVEASEAWKNPAPSSSRPGQGPQPGDQVRLSDIPDQAGSHAAIYHEWRGTVP